MLVEMSTITVEAFQTWAKANNIKTNVDISVRKSVIDDGGLSGFLQSSPSEGGHETKRKVLHIRS